MKNMNFENKIREKIREAPMGSPSRNVLRVLLGDLQKENATCWNSGRTLTEEKYFSIVRKFIESNKETLKYVEEGNPKFNVICEENKTLEALLPVMWDADKIKNYISEQNLDVKVGGEGQAVGLVMKSLKSVNAPVDGATVKSVVVGIRNG